MKNAWYFFLTAEALFFIWILWQLSRELPLLLVFLAGAILVYGGLRKPLTSKLKRLFLAVGWFLVFITLINCVAFWIWLLFTVLFLGLKGAELASKLDGPKWFWQQPQFISAVDAPVERSVKKQKWFGDERIGQDVFAWSDANLAFIAGDTIIDLGNTLLPKEDNVIIMQKGFGRTRILVPNGIGIEINHRAFLGKVQFDTQEFSLRNEQLTCYSTDYKESARHLKIVTNVLVGDLEVIRL